MWCRKTSDGLVSICATLLLGCTGCHMAVDGHNLSGVRMYDQGQYQPALQRFQEALAADPSSADAYYNMAATYHRVGTLNGDQESVDQAETLYNQCLDLNPNHTDCNRALAVLLVETDRADSAFKLLKNWATTQPQVADARVELARLYHEFGDHETAKLHLNEAILVDQDNPRAWAALGQVREELQEYDQALANYQRSYELNKFQSGVATRIASLSRQMQGDLNVTGPGGTRTVTTGGGSQY